MMLRSSVFCLLFVCFVGFVSADVLIDSGDSYVFSFVNVSGLPASEVFRCLTPEGSSDTVSDVVCERSSFSAALVPGDSQVGEVGFCDYSVSCQACSEVPDVPSVVVECPSLDVGAVVSSCLEDANTFCDERVSSALEREDECLGLISGYEGSLGDLRADLLLEEDSVADLRVELSSVVGSRDSWRNSFWVLFVLLVFCVGLLVFVVFFYRGGHAGFFFAGEKFSDGGSGGSS